MCQQLLNIYTGEEPKSKQVQNRTGYNSGIESRLYIITAACVDVLICHVQHKSMSVQQKMEELQTACVKLNEVQLLCYMMYVCCV